MASVSQRVYLWCTLSLSDNVVQVVGDVHVQSTGQIPGLTDPMIILPPETHAKTSTLYFSAHGSTTSLLGKY